LSDKTPSLWTSFAVAWLLVLAVAVWRLPGLNLSPARLGGSAACLALIALSYLWLTVRHAPDVADLTAETPGGRPEPAAVGALAAMAASVFIFTFVAPGLEIWWLMMYPIVAAGLTLAPVVAAAAMALLIAVGFLAAWLTDGRIDAIFLLQITFGGSAVAFRHLTATVAQLRRARAELARAAVNDERLRFARDLHDLLGHSLSTIVLKSELAGRLVPRAPARAAAEIADVERTARDALQQVRAAVAGYRRPSLVSELAAARELLAPLVSMRASIHRRPRCHRQPMDFSAGRCAKVSRMWSATAVPARAPFVWPGATGARQPRSWTMAAEAARRAVRAAAVWRA
jgi:two-component system sensor histidine kinase DesK